ncbi:hypothetical protein [Saccharopolyspora shandongensis]|uniref:hypothetical protein n=1 Tax=Saccharopolyspora shandongensis TaxID=418495 RepID=UPI00115F7E65|nr:hypothetical protein [Saccharopolyspora shandongensis]
MLADVDAALMGISTGQQGIVHAQECLDEAGRPDGLGMLLGSRDEGALHALECADRAANELVRLHQMLSKIHDAVTPVAPVDQRKAGRRSKTVDW